MIDELNSIRVSLFFAPLRNSSSFFLPYLILITFFFLQYICICVCVSSFTFLSTFLSSTIDSKTHTLPLLHFPSLHIFLRLSKFLFIFHVTLQAYISFLFLSHARVHAHIRVPRPSVFLFLAPCCRGAFIWFFLVGRD